MRRIKFLHFTFSVTYLALMKDGNRCANKSHIDLPHYPFIVLHVNISDHEMIYTIRKKIEIKSDKCDFTGRSYRNYDTAEFIEILNQRDWNDFLGEENPNTLWRIFYNHVSETIDQLCPIRKFKIKKYKEPCVS